jgi:drug/metabolite transporter (DMT)-like permease
VLIALYGLLILGEGRSALRTVGLAASLGGMAIVSWNGQDLSALTSSRHFQGNMLALASGAAWGICLIAQKVAIPGRSNLSVVAPIFAVSAVTCGVAALFSPALVSDFSQLMLVALVLTGLLGMGLGNVLFTESMRTITASVGAASLAACPLLSLAGATLFLHEPASIYLLIGGPLTCVGVAAAMSSELAAVPGR